MAEAAVEERPPQRFYCHLCNLQFANSAVDVSNQFLEINFMFHKCVSRSRISHALIAQKDS